MAKKNMSRHTSSAVDFMTVSDTRKCLFEIRNKWKTSNPNNVLLFSDLLESAPPLLRPLSMETFAFKFVYGQAQKREAKLIKSAS